MIDYIELRGADRTLFGIVKDAISIIWQVEYIGTGNFEITFPYTEERWEWVHADILNLHNKYVTRPDRTELGFIENSKVSYSATDGNMITISGRFGCVLLERRVCYHYLGGIADSYRGQTYYIADGSNAEDVCRALVYRWLMDERFPWRNPSWFSLGTDHGFTDTTGERYLQYENLLETVNGILLNAYINPLGHKCVFDRDTLTMTYEVTKGQIRDIVFSRQYKNLISLEYSSDAKLFKNWFFIGGEGEGTDRFFTSSNWRYGEQPDPEAIRMGFYESNVSKTYNSGGGSQSIPDAAYAGALIRDCVSHYSDASTTESVSGTVDLTSYEYGVDYNVGDQVRLEGAVTQWVRLWSVTEVQDDNGYMINANFEGDSSNG